MDWSRGDLCLHMICYGFDEFFVVVVSMVVLILCFFVVVLVVVFGGDARGGWC